MVYGFTATGAPYHDGRGFDTLSVFDHWEGNFVGTDPVCVILNGPGVHASVTAVFRTDCTPTLSFDADGNCTADPFTDGILVVRRLLGAAGTDLTLNGAAIGGTPNRSTAAAIQAFIDRLGTTRDVDGNGNADAFTDGILLIRYMLGATGDSLILNGRAVGSGCTRCTAAAIQNYLTPLVGFPAPPNYAAGTGPQSLAIGDFNGDGKSDVAVANYGSRNVSILLGNGNGTFAPPVNYATGNSSRAVAVSDFNGDGKSDLAVANYSSGNVSILLGSGNGTFAPAVNYSIVDPVTYQRGDPVSVAVGDFNGDRKNDLAVANFSGRVSIMLGNGDGTFGPAVNYAVAVPYAASATLTSVAVGDFNGDGKSDLAVADSNPSYVSILLGNGNGTFAPAVNYATNLISNSVAVADFNGDGKSDLATANASGSVSILLGSGDGTFATPVNYALGDGSGGVAAAYYPFSVAVGDWNRDGKRDVAVANYLSSNVSILFGKGDGTFAGTMSYLVGSNPVSVAAGDFNGDGKSDIAVANYNSNGVSILMGSGTGTFAAASPGSGSDFSNSSTKER